MTNYSIDDGPKMLRETLCVAQTYIGLSHNNRKTEHTARLQRLIDECDRHRPLARNGKHGELHTPTCGCERAVPPPPGPRWSPGGSPLEGTND